MHRHTNVPWNVYLDMKIKIFTTKSGRSMKGHFECMWSVMW